MQLPIQMPGLGHVNMYALMDKDGAASSTRAATRPGTRSYPPDQADLKPKDVHTVFITHSHPDHFGGAVRLHKESGAHRGPSGLPFRPPRPRPREAHRSHDVHAQPSDHSRIRLTARTSLMATRMRTARTTRIARLPSTTSSRIWSCSAGSTALADAAFPDRRRAQRITTPAPWKGPAVAPAAGEPPMAGLRDLRTL